MAREIRLSMRVWDAPTRLFHWAVVLLVAFSYASESLNRMQWHFWSGYAVLALLLFRVAWGFVGSETARFSHFLRSPGTAFRYLMRFRERGPDSQIGHNAAGGWMVLVLLALLLIQTGSGLFANDEVLSEGPLAHLVSPAASDALTRIHGLVWNLLLAAVGLHVLAVLAYAVVRRQDLVRPMITGRKRLPATQRQPRMASPLLAAALVVVAAGLIWALVTLGG